MGDFQNALKFAELSAATHDLKDSEINLNLAELLNKNGFPERAFELLSHEVNTELQMDRKRMDYDLISTILEEKVVRERELEELVFQKKITQQKWYSLLGLISLLLAGAIAYLYWTNKNNKQLQKLNHTLKEKNKALNNFAYIASHDLKEPIRGIASFAQLLDRQLSENGSSEVSQEYLKYIQNNSKTLYKIIESLKVYTDVSLNPIQKGMFGVQEAFEELKPILEKLIAPYKGELTLPETLPATKIPFPKSLFLSNYSTINPKWPGV